jgi:hypothetical protein
MAAENGTVYFVTAGAGAALYELSQAEWVEKAVSAFHYVFVEATPSTFLLQAKTPEGETIDTFRLEQ